MSSSKNFRHCALFVLLLLLPGLAGATTFVRLTDADLADQAPVIAEVTFSGADPTIARNMPYTDYRVEVGRVLRGDVPGTGLVVRVQGGRAADGMQLKIYGAPTFKQGEKSLLFLRPAADGTYRILHLMQGAFRMVNEGDAVYVLRDFGQADELEVAGREIAAERPRELAKFESWLTDRAAGNARPADYFVDDASQMSAITQKYTLLDHDGLPMRWTAFDASQNIYFVAHADGQPGRSGGGFDDLQTAINAWNDEGATNIRYRYAGTTTTALAGFDHYDQVNAVLWNDLGDVGGFDDPFDCGTGGTIAIGGPWFDDRVTHSFHDRTFITIQGADVVTNKGLDCWINFGRRLEEVLAHELGHTLGLGHSCGDGESGPCDTNAKNDALMRATAHGDSRGASLRIDDLQAINILYGSGVNATPPNAPSNLSATAQPGTGILLEWDDNSSDETHFLLERRTGNGSFGEIHSTGAGASSYLDTDAASGTTYGYRVRAINDAGSSAYSNTATATAAGERAPTELSAVTTGATTIRLTWIDNATGESGYEVEAKLAGTVYSVIASIPANSSQYIASGLFADSSYSFRVRAKGGSGTSAYSNEATAVTSPAPIENCLETASVTCLNNGRFKVEIKWKDFGGVTGSGKVVPFRSLDSGLFYFFSAGNWEMLIKVLNGCSINNRFWVYAAATTNVEYTLFVTDTHTGRTRSYYNPLGANSRAITDGSAFNTCAFPLDGSPEAAGTLAEMLPVATEAAPAMEQTGISAAAPALLPEGGTTCGAGGTALCLQNERFKVEVSWTDFTGHTGPGYVVPAGTADSGLFYFFSPNNWELLIKVLDGCAINGHYWVLGAATTDVAYTLKVTDQNNPGSPKLYTNPLGVASPAVIDIGAFTGCN